MSKMKGYVGIDYFRIVAAFLVIAIHTSPLSTYSETGDFILTRIIGRVAVPFFFMISGFFLISQYSSTSYKLKQFIKKTAFVYAVAILIYIPLNIYNHYFYMENLLPNIIKDIIFDGTLYHLWYLPASIIGGIISWYLVRKAGMKKALLIAGILYIIGMFGDSYYGIIEKVPAIKNIYSHIFEISDYTRNGVFFSPIFFILGGVIAEKPNQISIKKSLVNLIVSFILMLAEGLILHRINVQRHDSMYIMLLPCMFFLFTVLIHWRGQRVKILRSLALIIYIIHPMIIVVIRMFAKILGMQDIFIDNSIIYYVVTSIATVLAALAALYLYQKFHHTKKRLTPKDTDRAWVEIDLDNLKHNVKTLQKAMPENCELMAVVKAEAYGHKSFEVSSFVNHIGVKAFAVATIEEGISLRHYGILGDILILGYTSVKRAKELQKYNLTQTLIDYDYAISLSRQGYKIKSHIKIDTGMKRLGFHVDEVTKISEVYKLKELDVWGIYTHLCVSDSPLSKDVEFTKLQVSLFYSLLEKLKEGGINIGKVHIQSSYGFLNYPEIHCNFIRVGIALYGALNSPKDKTKLQLDLRPVLELKSRIVLIKKIKKGESLGYNRAFVADADKKVAILPIGYADGVPRNLSCGKGKALVHGHLVPIVGKVCMDQLAIDITDVKEAFVGDVVTLIGKDGEKEISASMVADMSNTIPNEILSRLGTRLKVYHNF